MPPKASFTFEISLSVLNHLGRNLYRSFATVLGEAISNAWDADANSVWINVSADGESFSVKDDGIGMNADDFQNKFLKIGYSKRQSGKSESDNGRPFIGRKGIGKLALLSCARKISVISKKTRGEYAGGTIDNSKLDEAITKDLTPQQYPLGNVDMRQFASLTKGHNRGTIIRFEGIHDGVKRSFDFLSKIIALYFRFSLLDKAFKIFLNGERITHKHLKDLADRTQFLWIVGKSSDPYVKDLEGRFKKQRGQHEKKRIAIKGCTGFVASVVKPRDLKVMTTDERVGIDLFVNGRLREKDIMKHLPTAQVPESYLYGQIHFNALDDHTDRFTSSREGIVADDPKFQAFLDRFRKAALKIVEEWDEWRRKHRADGDPENERISKTQRASLGLFNAVSQAYGAAQGAKTSDKVEAWVSGLSDDATFNFESYAECFVSENLLRTYIQKKPVPLSKEAKDEAAKWKKREQDSKNKGNVSIQVRKAADDLSYLSMDDLANLVDKPQDKTKQAALARDASEFKPMRDAVAHTALLTDEAKARLKTVRANIKARVKTLLGTK